MRRLFLRLFLLTIALTSCSPAGTPSPNPEMTPSPEPTVISSPSPASDSRFIILAYATDGLFADIIPYEKLTHLN